METIEEQRTHHGSINLVSLKTEILSALSTVGTRQASKNSGRRTRPIRKLSAPLEAWVIARTSEPGIANQIRVEWVALGEATFCEGHANIARQVPTTSKRERR